MGNGQTDQIDRTPDTDQTYGYWIHGGHDYTPNRFDDLDDRFDNLDAARREWLARRNDWTGRYPGWGDGQGPDTGEYVVVLCDERTVYDAWTVTDLVDMDDDDMGNYYDMDDDDDDMDD